MKLSEAFDLYEKYITIKGQSDRTIEHCRYIKVRLIECVGDIKLSKLSLDDIHKWKVAMTIGELPNGRKVKRAQNSLRGDILRLRVMLKYMSIIGEKCINYELIPLPKREDIRRTFLYEDEVAAMIDNAFSLRNKFIISLLYSSGIRLSEFIALDRNSIKGRSFTVIGKGKKLRLCFIDERTEKLMKQYLRTRRDNCPALVVSNLYKQRMTASNVQLLIRNSAKRAGIDKTVTPHVFRHSFATNFISNNGGIKPLSELLGHKSLDTTSIYTHLVNNELSKQYERFHTF
ncbi:tyrosine-type recombinase/integrase [Candidatus Saccharibacteria bacterium]|nr:tyrosine-type recombinase/integrase [Candidatus Saccharibacteria bacterium]